MKSVYAGLCLISMGTFLAFMRYMQTGFGDDFGAGFSIGCILAAGVVGTAMSIERRRNRVLGLDVNGDPVEYSHRDGA